MHVRTFYTVHSLYWNEGNEYVAPYWATGGCGPDGYGYFITCPECKNEIQVS